MYEQNAKVEVERAMEKTRILLGFAPEDYEIRKIDGKLGKCEDNKITIDPRIVMHNRNIICFLSTPKVVLLQKQPMMAKMLDSDNELKTAMDLKEGKKVNYDIKVCK